MVQTMDTRIQSNIGTDYPSGFDGGNTDTCFSAFVNGQEHTVVLPSTVLELTSKRLKNIREAVSQVVAGGEEPVAYEQYKQDITLEYSGKTYLVGYSAMIQSQIVHTQRGDVSRYYSVPQLVRLLATSAMAVQNQSHYSLKLITTVPYLYYTKEIKKAIKNTLSGVHNFKINGVEKTAVIEVKQVLIEGSPALVLYGAKSANSQRLIIDGGGQTTEFLMFSGRDPIQEQCFSEEFGVETIGTYVADQLLEQHNRAITPLEKTNILRAYGSRNATQPLPYPEISCGRYILPAQELHGMCRSGAEILADETVAFAGRFWKRTNDIVAGGVIHQFHMGGAVHFINDIIREKHMPNLTAVAKAETANARGCAQLAKFVN